MNKRLHPLNPHGLQSVLLSADIKLSAPVLDCHRIGKYNPKHRRPCPLLAKFISLRDVHQVLDVHSRPKLPDSSPIYIKKDLPKEERRLESILLKEHHSLLSKGANQVKIQGNKLFINSKLHGHGSLTGFVTLQLILLLSPLASQNPLLLIVHLLLVLTTPYMYLNPMTLIDYLYSVFAPGVHIV